MLPKASDPKDRCQEQVRSEVHHQLLRALLNQTFIQLSREATTRGHRDTVLKTSAPVATAQGIASGDFSWQECSLEEREKG